MEQNEITVSSSVDTVDVRSLSLSGDISGLIRRVLERNVEARGVTTKQTGFILRDQQNFEFHRWRRRQASQYSFGVVFMTLDEFIQKHEDLEIVSWWEGGRAQITARDWMRIEVGIGRGLNFDLALQDLDKKLEVEDPKVIRQQRDELRGLIKAVADALALRKEPETIVAVLRKAIEEKIPDQIKGNKQ